MLLLQYSNTASHFSHSLCYTNSSCSTFGSFLIVMTVGISRTDRDLLLTVHSKIQYLIEIYSGFSGCSYILQLQSKIQAKYILTANATNDIWCCKLLCSSILYADTFYGEPTAVHILTGRSA
jgi:hypothetical protein